MKEYIKSIVPRLKRFSESLDKKSILVDQPWVIIDDKGNFEKLIFKKNQELIMSKNSEVTVGKWEYLPSAKSLLIDRIRDKVLLNQVFIDKGILVLKHDGFSDNYFLLANENIIPDLNIESYLKQIFYQKYNIGIIESSNNQSFEVIRDYSSEEIGLIGQSVLLNTNEIDDCSFQSKESKINYYIKDGKIKKTSTVFERKAQDGTKLLIEKFFYEEIHSYFGKGDIVRLQSGQFANDGTYKIGLFKKIKVKDGVIV